jgi:hypothetical protein
MLSVQELKSPSGDSACDLRVRFCQVAEGVEFEAKSQAICEFVRAQARDLNIFEGRLR